MLFKKQNEDFQMKDKVIGVIVGVFVAVALLFVFQSASVFIELSVLTEIGELTEEAEEAVGKSLSYRAFYLAAAFITAYFPVFIASRVRKTSSLVPPVVTMAFVSQRANGVGPPQLIELE